MKCLNLSLAGVSLTLFLSLSLSTFAEELSISDQPLVTEEPDMEREVPVEESSLVEPGPTRNVGSDAETLSEVALHRRISALLTTIECEPTTLALAAEIEDRTRDLQAAEALVETLQRQASALEQSIVDLARELHAIHPGAHESVETLIDARTIHPASRALALRESAREWEAHAIALRGHLGELTVEELLHEQTCSGELGAATGHLPSPPALPVRSAGANNEPQLNDEAAAAHRDRLLRDAGLR